MVSAFGGGEHWNYRVGRKTGPDDYVYDIYSVYYDKRGAIHAHSSKPARPTGETPTELFRDMQMMAKALREPILDLDVKPIREVIV